MSDNYGWTDEQVKELLRLAKSGSVLNKDIAEKLGKKPMSVGWKLKKLGVKNTAYLKVIGKGNKRYSDDLRKKAISFFKSHTAREVAEKFNLTHGQIIGLLETSRRSGLLPSAFKDKRTKEPWTGKDYRFLLAHAGLMPRDWIAKKLNRGGELGIKDRLDMLGVSSVNLNGLTISKFRILFGEEPTFYLQTKAGPQRKFKNRDGAASFYKIIPWVWMDQEIKAKRLKVNQMHRKMIRSMAMFQEWIHGGDALKKMKRICNGRT